MQQLQPQSKHNKFQLREFTTTKQNNYSVAN